MAGTFGWDLGWNSGHRLAVGRRCDCVSEDQGELGRLVTPRKAWKASSGNGWQPQRLPVLCACGSSTCQVLNLNLNPSRPLRSLSPNFHQPPLTPPAPLTLASLLCQPPLTPPARLTLASLLYQPPLTPPAPLTLASVLCAAGRPRVVPAPPCRAPGRQHGVPGLCGGRHQAGHDTAACGTA